MKMITFQARTERAWAAIYIHKIYRTCSNHHTREDWMIYRGPGFLAVVYDSASRHCCQIQPGLLGQFSQKNSAAGEKNSAANCYPRNQHFIQYYSDFTSLWWRFRLFRSTTLLKTYSFTVVSIFYLILGHHIYRKVCFLRNIFHWSCKKNNT
jgi:hypothetical protein